MRAVKQFALEREIPFLVHFTRAGNLPSILEHGLYPVSRMDELGVEFHINDQFRLDGRLNGTSVSIGFPNCQMFYKYRMEDQSVDWAVLIIDPSVLWEKRCAFYCHNAADARISAQPLEALTSWAAFRGMFHEIQGCDSREESRLKSFDPTDVQAEVMILDVIEPTYIQGIVFDSKAVRDTHTGFLNEDQKAWLHPKCKGMFATRTYYRKYQ